MQEIADEVGVHISTVSRGVAGKYAQTPRGIFPLKFFFTGGTTKSSGEEASQITIKERIKKIVGAEDPEKPLSDDAIARALEDEDGIKIARRTVTKYRKALEILLRSARSTEPLPERRTDGARVRPPACRSTSNLAPEWRPPDIPANLVGTMNLKATELRKGQVLVKDGNLLLITDNHSTPGNWRAIIQVKTRNLVTGQNGSFRPAAGDQFDVPRQEEVPVPLPGGQR